MVPLGLFQSRAFTGANLVTALLYAALGACLFFVPFNLIEVQRYAPAAAGAALLPLVVSVSLLSRWSGTLVARTGPRLPMVCGSTLAALGFALLALPGNGGSYWSTFFPGITALGIGMGVTVTPLTATAMSAAGSQHAGLASGINNAIARTASLLAVAALGVLLLDRFEHALARELDALHAFPSRRAPSSKPRARGSPRQTCPGTSTGRCAPRCETRSTPPLWSASAGSWRRVRCWRRARRSSRWSSSARCPASQTFGFEAAVSSRIEVVRRVAVDGGLGGPRGRCRGRRGGPGGRGHRGRGADGRLRRAAPRRGARHGRGLGRRSRRWRSPRALVRPASEEWPRRGAARAARRWAMQPGRRRATRRPWTDSP